MRAVVAAAEQVAKVSPTRVGIDEPVMTNGRLLERRREFLTALVCLDTSLAVAVSQGRDKGSAAALLAEHAPGARVVACELFSGFKSAAEHPRRRRGRGGRVPPGQARAAGAR